MSRYIPPGATEASRFSAGAANTGLAGTVRFRLIDADQTADDPVVGPTTTGVVEDPTGSGDYMIQVTAPATEGVYFPAWDLGSGQLYYDEDWVVTRTATDPFVAAGHEYVTRDELKTILGVSANDYADLAIDINIDAASRAVDGYKGTRYYSTAETRYYTADPTDTSISIDDLNTLTAVTVDTDGDGTYETAWVNGTDFVLLPANAAADGRPWNTVSLLEQGNQRFPSFQNAVKVQGSFGWASTPTLAKQAAILLANKLLVETRQAPMGVVLAVANETVALARLGSIHPDAKFLLDQLPGGAKKSFASLQLT